MKEQQALQRMRLVLQVQAGQKTAKAAARELGISRQAFHQWMKRGLHALLQAMEEQPPGRPRNPRDEQKEALEEQVQRLRQRTDQLQTVAALRKDLLRSMEEEPSRPDVKKKNDPSTGCSTTPST